MPPTPPCSPWRSRGWGRQRRTLPSITPGLLERGVEIETRFGLVLEYYNSPRYALSRLLMCLGEIERPRSVLAELETKRRHEATKVPG